MPSLGKFNIENTALYMTFPVGLLWASGLGLNLDPYPALIFLTRRLDRGSWTQLAQLGPQLAQIRETIEASS